MLSLCTHTFSGVMKIKAERIVAVNDQNLPIGEDHHNAKFTNQEIDLIRHLYEVDKIRISHLAIMFECSKGMIHKICNYEIRNQSPASHKRVKVEVDV